MARGFQTSWAPRGARQQSEARRIRIAAAKKADAAPTTESGLDQGGAGGASREARYIGYFTSDPL